MTPRIGHPLAYPLSVTLGALAVLAAWAPFADPDQLSALVVVGCGVVGYSGYRVAVAFAVVRSGVGEVRAVPVRRVRQQYRLTSRSWLELGESGRGRWLPVYFSPEMLGFTGGTATVRGKRVIVQPAGSFTNQDDAIDLRVFPAGRVRDTEPPGRLIDNPARIDPAASHATTKGRIGRRLLLDAQPTVAAPFAGLLWVYVMSDGLLAFIGVTCVSAALAVWLAAIRGSDPS